MGTQRYQMDQDHMTVTCHFEYSVPAKGSTPSVGLYFKVNPDQSLPPAPQAKMAYSKEEWSKGEAWKNLSSNPPNFEYQGEIWTTLFRMTSSREPRYENPYRAAHTATHWVYEIVECRLGKSRRGKPISGRIPRYLRSSRYELLDQDWL